MKAPHGTLKAMAEKHGSMSVAYISNVVNRQKGIRKARAEELEKLAHDALGLDIPAQVWMFGTTKEIKMALKAWDGKAPSGEVKSLDSTSDC